MDETKDEWRSLRFSFSSCSACRLGWLFHRHSKVRWASEKLLPEISRLIDEDKYVAAFALARAGRKIHSQSPVACEIVACTFDNQFRSVRHLLAPTFTSRNTMPSMLLGRIWASRRSRIFRIPSGLFRWKVEKKGFATAEDVASGWYPISFTLDPVESVPPGMVRVSGSDCFQSNDHARLRKCWTRPLAGLLDGPI